jgi:hypothetical protein
MQAAARRSYVTVEDCLSEEATSRLKHEYLDGAVFAMAGTTLERDQIAINITTIYEGVTFTA